MVGAPQIMRAPWFKIYTLIEKISYIEGMVTGPAGKQATVRFLVDSGATYTLLPHQDWQSIGLLPKRSVSFSLMGQSSNAMCQNVISPSRKARVTHRLFLENPATKHFWGLSH